MEDAQHSHSLDGQRREGDTLASLGSRQAAKDDPERMTRIDFIVPIGDQDERARHSDATPEQAQEIERRLVRPVHVLQHQHRRFTLQLFEQCVHDVVRGPHLRPSAWRGRRRSAQRHRRLDRADVE
jgi:hypothetical protein